MRGIDLTEAGVHVAERTYVGGERPARNASRKGRMSVAVPIAHWGRRLADALREAIFAGDPVVARVLALEGDGQARSLAGEQALLARGLGITVNVLTALLPGLAARIDGAADGPARAAALACIRAFRADIDAIAEGFAAGESAPAGEAAASPDALADEIARASESLHACLRAFDRRQSQLAARVERALDVGDAPRALEVLDDKELRGWLPLHDRLVRFMAQCFAWALECGGHDALLAIHLGAAEGQRAGFEKWERMDAREFTWTSAYLLKQHMGEVAVREDDEKFTIEQTPCGSGGRLVTSGAYEGPAALPIVEGAGPLTFGRPALPVYCSHCPIWNGAATLRWFGRAHWVFSDPARADGGCTLHVYKRREDIPREYAQRVGVPEAGRAGSGGTS